jgi:hypothetical protein
VAVNGSLALLAAREYGLVVVDFSNPASPAVVGKADLDADDSFASPTMMYAKAFSIAVSNNIAYVGVYNMDTSSEAPDNGAAMIYAFDLSNPTRPRLVSLSANGGAGDFVASLWASGTELIGGSTSAIEAFDISQPRSAIGRFLLPAALRAPQTTGSIAPAVRSVRGTSIPRVNPNLPRDRSWRVDLPRKFQASTSAPQQK